MTDYEYNKQASKNVDKLKITLKNYNESLKISNEKIEELKSLPLHDYQLKIWEKKADELKLAIKEIKARINRIRRSMKRI